MVLSIADYVIQGGIFLLTFVHPWFLPLERGARAFGLPFVAIFVWGIWRVLHFDPTTHNDVPGMGYFVCAFFYGFISFLLYRIRCVFLRRRARK